MQEDGPNGTKWVTVNTIAAGSQAEKAGVLVGDRILALNEKVIVMLTSPLEQTRVRSTVTLHFFVDV